MQDQPESKQREEQTDRPAVQKCKADENDDGIRIEPFAFEVHEFWMDTCGPESNLVKPRP